MSIKIVKGAYSSVVDSESLSGNQTLTLPNASGTVALTNQFATVATSGSYNDLSGKPTLAKVATSGSYNDLSNKPSIPESQQGYITQTWRSGNNWYRVYSDGWIEQGGFNTGTTSGSGATITVQLHKTYPNTQYFICKNSIWEWNDAITGKYLNFWNITTSSAQTQDINASGKHGFSWFACGYETDESVV